MKLAKHANKLQLKLSQEEWLSIGKKAGWTDENDYEQNFPAGPKSMKNYLSKDDIHPHSHEKYYGEIGGIGRGNFMRDVSTITPMLKDIVAYLQQNSDNYQYQAHVLNAAL